MSSDEVANALKQVQEQMAEEAAKTHANITFSLTLPDGAVFELKYKLPKKGR